MTSNRIFYEFVKKCERLTDRRANLFFLKVGFNHKNQMIITLSNKTKQDWVEETRTQKELFSQPHIYWHIYLHIQASLSNTTLIMLLWRWRGACGWQYVYDSISVFYITSSNFTKTVTKSRSICEYFSNEGLAIKRIEILSLNFLFL